MSKAAENRRQATRAKLITTAQELFSSKGYHNTQVMDVVKEARVSAGTFYIYFKNKRELFEQLAFENLSNLRSELWRLRQQSIGGNLPARLRTVRDAVEAFFDYADKNSQQLLMILRGGFGVDEVMDGATWQYFSGFAHDLASDVEKWKNLGVIGDVNPFLFGHITLGMVLQVLHSYLVERQFTREEAVDTLVQVFTATFSMYLTPEGKKLLRDRASISSQG